MPYAIATSIIDARKNIESRIRSWWVTDSGKSADHIAWPNVDFATPTGTEWLQVAIIFGESFQRTFCATTSQNQRVGVITLTIFGAKNEGRNTLETLASSAMAKFERQIFQGIECLGVTGSADIADPAFASAQVSIRFQFYETVSPAVTV